MIDLKKYLEAFSLYFPDLSTEEPWNITARLPGEIEKKVRSLGDDYEINGSIAIHKNATVEADAVIKGPVIISEGCFIAAHAYLRGGVFIAKNSNIGPGSEVKTSIILENSALAHFNFVGDSIVGSNVNMEAGSVIANHYNEREDKTIYILMEGNPIAISSKKFGALIGDATRIGANAVLSPGTILPKQSIVKRLELIEQMRR